VNAVASTTARAPASLFGHQLRCEQLIFWRSREAAVFVFLFPLLLFLLLGTVYDGTYHGHELSEYLVGGLLGYGTANTAFGGLAITLVLRREQGVLKRVRSTPLPPAVYLTAAIASILAVFALQAILIVAMGRLVFDAALPSRPFSLAVALVVGGLAFAALGTGVAALIRSAEGSSAVVNVIILPMTFLSGGFGPTRDYPRILQAIAAVLPLKHLIDAVQGIYLDGEPVWDQGWALLIVFTWGLVGVSIAVRKFRWEPREG